MVENSRFMTEARRKELDRGKQMQRSKEELTSMLVGKNERGNSRYFLILVTAGTSHAAAAIQQPVVE